jgi:5-(carboxyamino)imidazole ribonucleotide mutase
MTDTARPPAVHIVMGSQSDWDVMQAAASMLERLQVPHRASVVSAHRMPDDMFRFAEGARAAGLRAIIAGAGGAAHLPGMIAAKTTVPVLGVPVPSRHLQGVDSLYSIVQMPKGIPVPRCSPRRCWRPTTLRWPRGSRTSARSRPRRRAR